MSLDVASQCKANEIMEIFVQVLVTSRQKYLLADRSTLGATIGRFWQFWDEGRWMAASTIVVRALH